MDKSAIKKYAIWARKELMERVAQKADQYEISADADPNAESVHGVLLTMDEKKQRAALIRQIKEKGKDQVIEEVSYTWFNRFVALRFMEVNNYLPSRVRVFTDENGNFKPEILTEAIHLDLNGLDMKKVYALKDSNDDEALFKYLIITQCNALSSVLPGMFQKIADDTELLFPDNLLREGSVVEQMIALIPEEEWKDQVQIIGWLYQYYNTEPKDKVFADLKKKKKITKEKIPAATQLFTPDWIVRYMVENSLGRLWLDGHPNEDLKANWKYYLDEAEQESDVHVQLISNREEYKVLEPKDILCIDPCSGSGHILVYMFDVLVQIYEAYGVDTKTAVANIVENNIYGLDIDDRAAQLAYFSIMMKACQYDKRFLRRKIQPHVYAIVESNYVDPHIVEYFCNGNSKLKKAMETIIDELHNAKEYGSIITVSQQDWKALYNRFDEIQNENIPSIYTDAAIRLRSMVEVARALAQKYDVVLTNPPYMGRSGMSVKLSTFVKKNYSDSKSDLFAVFIEKCGQMVKENGYQAMITQHAWMFISSFQNLRKKLYKRKFVSLIHLGIKAFEEIGNDVVQTCAFVVQGKMIDKYISKFVRLVDCKNYFEKEQEYLAGHFQFTSKVSDFKKIPGMPFAYWVGPQFISNFIGANFIENYGMLTGSQNITGNNEKYLRCFWEVSESSIGRRWFFYAKGGDYRQYYGDLSFVVDWSDEARNFYSTNKTSNLLGKDFWFKPGITYSAITSRGTGFRYLPEGCIFDKGGPSIILKSDIPEILALLNTNVAKYYFGVLNPSINLQVKDVKNFPIILLHDENVIEMAKKNLTSCKQDWDSQETSWNFQHHPLLRNVATIEEAFNQWKNECEIRFNQLKENEEKINRIFISIYGLDKEVISEVEDRDVTVHHADLKQDVRSFISYAVGCMFGRYSIDIDGIAYAGGKWDENKYFSFPVVKDNIIPICDDDYFEDDIVGLFIKFVKTVYGANTLDKNLKFIANALEGKGQPKDVIRNYFLNNFYSDHCSRYSVTGSGKRPIYWLFDSGKKNGFKCLIYMHRYQSDTIARIRTDYVHEQQARYRTAISGLERQINDASSSKRIRLNKQLTKLRDQAEETRLYEEKIHHLADQMISIDLDDGVKHNYEMFGDVLANIK